MTILVIFWASLTLVFGLPTIKNLAVKCWSLFTKRGYRQSTFGIILDRCSLANMITFFVYFAFYLGEAK